MWWVVVIAAAGAASTALAGAGWRRWTMARADGGGTNRLILVWRAGSPTSCGGGRVLAGRVSGNFACLDATGAAKNVCEVSQLSCGFCRDSVWLERYSVDAAISAVCCLPEHNAGSGLLA